MGVYTDSDTYYNYSFQFIVFKIILYNFLT